MKVLYLLSHAPHYREQFLRELASKCELTVFARPCASASLIPPTERIGYRYVEAESNVRWRRFGLEAVSEERQLIDEGSWDAICAGWNPRHTARFSGWLRRGKVARKWVWAGMFYGRRGDSRTLRSIRRFVLNRSDGVLGYTQDVIERLQAEGLRVPAAAFNNSNVLRSDFVPVPLMVPEGSLNLICVGRYQVRKRIDRLVALARRNSSINVRLVGPGMIEGVNSIVGNGSLPNLEAYPAATGDLLRDHLAWSHVVVMPGALGLLALTAAQASRPLIVASDGAHGPEIAIARNSGQLIIDWNDTRAIDEALSLLLERPSEMVRLGNALHDYAKAHHTIEQMASVYASMLGLSA